MRKIAKDSNLIRCSHLISLICRHLNFLRTSRYRATYRVKGAAVCPKGEGGGLVKLFSFLSRLCRKSHRERVTTATATATGFSLSSEPHLMSSHANPMRSPEMLRSLDLSPVRQFAIVIIIFSVTWQLRVVQKKKKKKKKKNVRHENTLVRPDPGP